VRQDLVYDFDMYADPRLHLDPHEGLLALQREAPPIFYTLRYGGHWVITRNTEIFEAMQDMELFSNRGAVIPPPPVEPPDGLPSRMIPVDVDPPDHEKYRKTLARVFSPKSVGELESDTRRLAVELIEKFKNQRECEFVRDVATPLPSLIFMKIMGMPSERYEELAGWVDEFFGAADFAVSYSVLCRIDAYFEILIKERQQAPEQLSKNDIVSQLLAADIDGRKLRLDEILAMCRLLFVAGLDTVTNTLAFTARVLAENPDLQRQLRDDPALIPEAAEEIMRRTAVSNTLRRVGKDGLFHGVELHKGEQVLVCLPLAGLDDKAVEDPELVDFHRKLKNHFAFGAGPHRCLGSHLARVELRVFLEEWLKRIPAFGVKPDTTLRYRPGIVNAMIDLPLVWPTAA
jgi:cytochrome P450